MWHVCCGNHLTYITLRSVIRWSILLVQTALYSNARVCIVGLTKWSTRQRPCANKNGVSLQTASWHDYQRGKCKTGRLNHTYIVPTTTTFVRTAAQSHMTKYDTQSKHHSTWIWWRCSGVSFVRLHAFRSNTMLQPSDILLQTTDEKGSI